MISHVLSS